MGGTDFWGVSRPAQEKPPLLPNLRIKGCVLLHMSDDGAGAALKVFPKLHQACCREQKCMKCGKESSFSLYRGWQ